MSILGFSHIVTEVGNFEKAISFYEKLGYVVEYEVSQEVPEKKKRILKGEPASVQLYYLRNQSDSRIGIELIKHNDGGISSTKKKLSYGWSKLEADLKIVRDLDNNNLVEFNSCSGQHIFLPTDKFQETQNFYLKELKLEKCPIANSMNDVYNSLYNNYQRTSVLGMKHCLAPSWNLNLHIIETNLGIDEVFLNSYGFICFCVLVRKDEYNRILNGEREIIGSFKCEKEVNGKPEKFEISFVRDPNGYLVEYYLQC